MFDIKEPVKLVGLTGGIATGKSAVANILRRWGVVVIDADELAREVVRPGEQAWKEVVESFGPDVLTDDQNLDRRKLRRIIFDNPEARKKLEAIIHPRVRSLAETKIHEAARAGHSIVVYEVPLLFETQMHHWLRPVVLVSCTASVQQERLQKRDHLTEAEAAKHIQAQMSLETKSQLADYVIENNGTLQHLQQQLKRIWEKIRAI